MLRYHGVHPVSTALIGESATLVAEVVSRLSGESLEDAAVDVRLARAALPGSNDLLLRAPVGRRRGLRLRLRFRFRSRRLGLRSRSRRRFRLRRHRLRLGGRSRCWFVCIWVIVDLFAILQRNLGAFFIDEFFVPCVHDVERCAFSCGGLEVLRRVESSLALMIGRLNFLRDIVTAQGGEENDGEDVFRRISSLLHLYELHAHGLSDGRLLELLFLLDRELRIFLFFDAECDRGDRHGK